MEALSKFTITVSRYQRSTDSPFTDPKVWIRMQANEETPGAVNWISFLLVGAEWRELFEGSTGHFSDIAHQLNAFGESWTFYDLDYPRAPAGRFALPYRRVIMPRPVTRIILADIESALAEFDASEPGEYGWKTDVVLDYADKLAEWGHRFGQGKGTIKIEGNPEVCERLGALIGSSLGGETFERSWESIRSLALNSTHSVDDVGVIQIFDDHAGFCWRAGGMYGGLINHGSDDEPNWSVHT